MPPSSGLGPCLPLAGGPGRVIRPAEGAAQAQPSAPGRAWAGPKKGASCWETGLRAACSSILLIGPPHFAKHLAP